MTVSYVNRSNIRHEQHACNDVHSNEKQRPMGQERRLAFKMPGLDVAN